MISLAILGLSLKILIANLAISINEYILLKGINDSIDHARQLKELIKDTFAYVNLIPYNEVSENKYKRSDAVHDFFDYLMKNKVNATIRKEFGTDIDAACGQLRAKNERR